MYDFIIGLNQPPPKPKPAPAPKPAPKPDNKSKAKELEEVRGWWANLPESSKQEIRNTKYWLSPAKPPKEKKPKPKPKPKPKDDGGEKPKEE